MRVSVAGALLLVIFHVQAKLDTDEEQDATMESVDRELDSNERKNITQSPVTSTNSSKEIAEDFDAGDSSENIGASLTQIYRHPYAASLLKNDTYVCSAIILNTYWLITVSKCFNMDVISSYVTHRKLDNYTVRVGSSYNDKGGELFKIKMMINNFELKVSLLKLEAPLVFGSRVRSVQLPSTDDEVTLGYLASIIAWTPVGHMRVVSAPVIESSICESFTKLSPGHYICIGGVQDPNRHFCRMDNGGAVIQNNTLVGISSFLHTCALYSRSHAFPKVSSFSRWIDTVIWDEEPRKTTAEISASTTKTSHAPEMTEKPATNSYFQDPRKFMLTLPFDPINVPLEPAEDNQVLPRLSLYEAYLQNMAKAKTSTTVDPNVLEERQREWVRKFGKSAIMMPPNYFGKAFNQFGYA